MNGPSFALSILGLDKTELIFCNVLLDLHNKNKYGEIPGKNLRDLLGLTKETLFELIKSLEEVKILVKIENRDPIPCDIYIVAGNGKYIFQPEPCCWIPRSESIFYQICKTTNLRTNVESYYYILNTFDIFLEPRQPKIKDESLKSYGVYERFCMQYKKSYGKEYKTKNINRDLVHAKNVLFEARMKGMRDNQIKDFVDWAVRTARGDMIIGFLPNKLTEYLSKNNITLYCEGTMLDENGHLKAIS